MAEKIEEEKALSSSQNPICPLCLCLDIFDDPTLLTSCGHTFCQKCLKKYDLSHQVQNIDHMVCPFCRKITKLSENRADDLLTNVTVNELVDDYHGKCGEVNAVFETHPKCTACKLQREAVSFCTPCSSYMCEECLTSHQDLSSMKGHEVVSIQDINDGNVSIGYSRSSEKCSTHKQENKDLFRDDCKVHVCHKCGIVSHHNHRIKNQVDFEQDLRLKVNDLVQRCAAKKSELEKNIQNVGAQRREVHTAIQKLREDVLQAYSVKAKQLEENQRIIMDQLNEFNRSFDDDLDVLKSNISESHPELQAIQCVDLCLEMWGMTKYSEDSVAIVNYGGYSVIIDSSGNKQKYENIPRDLNCYDLVFQQDRSVCISTGSTEVHIYSPNGSRKSTIHVTNNPGYHLNLNRSPSDEILVTNFGKQVYIYDPTGTTLQHTVPTEHETVQASSTRSGLIVTSSCNRCPSIVTVYDRDGNAGKPLQAPRGVELYAAVDRQDRVYVASVDFMNNNVMNVMIRLYDLDGLELKERVEFNALNLTLGNWWCNLVSLSPGLLAFACDLKLHFIKVSL